MVHKKVGTQNVNHQAKTLLSFRFGKWGVWGYTLRGMDFDRRHLPPDSNPGSKGNPESRPPLRGCQASADIPGLGGKRGTAGLHLLFSIMSDLKDCLVSQSISLLSLT